MTDCAAMAGIVGVGRTRDVMGMLERMAHRGRGAPEVWEVEGATLGAIPFAFAALPVGQAMLRHSPGEGHFAEVRVSGGRARLERDRLGVVPLYHGRTRDGELAFASEVGALLEVASEIHEASTGSWFDGATTERVAELVPGPLETATPEEIARELRRRLASAVERRVRSQDVGSWLSGGIDSSAVAALARPHLRVLHTFAAGLAGAPDLAFARDAAAHIGSCHHERVASLDDLRRAVPDVIRHLESFDALLVRSSLMNYLVARLASEHVAEVFSGEGGDELFAGYEYLKKIAPDRLADKLLDIVGRLHNTALQRVDRCAAAHGLRAHVCFLDPGVVDYAVRIPVGMKLHRGIEKWILRQAMGGLLPEGVRMRPKARFWEGAGVEELLADWADATVSDADFARERVLPNGWTLGGKEELFYYRVFREQVGAEGTLDWMGRTRAVTPEP